MSDPRFDPRFQRGYAGPQPVPSGAAAPPPSRALSDPVAPEPTPIDGEPAEPRPAPALLPSALEDADESSAPQAAPAGRNPYALALLIGGVLLFVTGTWWAWSSAGLTNVSAESDPDAQLRAQAISLLGFLMPPALLIGGLLGIVGWLVLGALGVPSRQAR